MANNHIKRSTGFYMEVLQIAQKLMGVHTKEQLKRAAELLVENTHDSSCMLNAASTEPVFVLRAKDPVARVALKAWIDAAEQNRLHADKLDDARQCLKEFLEYQP